MRVHFIAIGGAVMHNLALALQALGHSVTGSDDEIFDPARTRLAQAGILPETMGWVPARIGREIDAIILGMHARADNPELARARELGLSIYSFPEFMYLQTCGKTRLVVAGSHGKTTVTALIMHVLRLSGRKFDFLVGAQLDGFSTMVGLNADSEMAVFEGDEYLSSAIDRRPKFLLYRPDIALVNGIAWDHINVFPTFEQYRGLFVDLVRSLAPGSTLSLNMDDPEVRTLEKALPGGVILKGYQAPEYAISEGQFTLSTDFGPVPVQLIGRHNMLNVEAARSACSTLGVSDEDFYRFLPSFQGAARRLNLVRKGTETSVYLDFAHSPSKVRATTDALKEAFPARRLVACLELHTFSSLNRDFLSHYRGTLQAADQAVVYFDPHTLALKRLPPLDPAKVLEAFEKEGLEVIQSRDELTAFLKKLSWKNSNLLLMSSGSFSGLDVPELAAELVEVI